MENLFVGYVDSLPEEPPLVANFLLKRERSDDEDEGNSPAKKKDKTMYPPASSQFVNCGKYLRKKRPNNDDDASEYIAYGSEEETEFQDAEVDTEIIVPRMLRPYYDLEDIEETNSFLNNEKPELNCTLIPHQSIPTPSSKSQTSAQGPGLKAPHHADSSTISDMDAIQIPPSSAPELFDFKWKPTPNPAIPPRVRRERYCQVKGPVHTFSEPYDAFVAIWDRPIMEHIATETNKYAEQGKASAMARGTLTKTSRLSSWKPTDADELYVYFAINIAMGIVIKSETQEYWNRDDGLFQTPGFSATMSRNRFLLLDRYIHFNDNDLLDDKSISKSDAKIFKIAPIVAHFNEKFPQLYQLGQNICLDESLTQWKGLLKIPNKLASSAFKTFEICETHSGYLYKFEIHVDSVSEEPTAGSPVSGFIPSLVLRLVNGLENRGHTLWMDRYYNSPALARVLKQRGIDCVGTINTNQPFIPKQINDLKTGKLPIQQGQLFGCTSDDVDIIVWRDIKTVSFVSTYHGAGTDYCTVEKRRKPVAAKDYSTFMAGVDKKDQTLAKYSIERKQGHVWYKKFFRRMLNASIQNAHIIWRASRPSSNRITQRVFRRTLVKTLVERHGTKEAVTAPPSEVFQVFTSEIVQHFTVPYGEARPGAKEKTRRACVVCHKRIRSYCPACNVALCYEPCAQEYHTGNQGPQPQRPDTPYMVP